MKQRRGFVRITLFDEKWTGWMPRKDAAWWLHMARNYWKGQPQRKGLRVINLNEPMDSRLSVSVKTLTYLYDEIEKLEDLLKAGRRARNLLADVVAEGAPKHVQTTFLMLNDAIHKFEGQDVEQS